MLFQFTMHCNGRLTYPGKCAVSALLVLGKEKTFVFLTAHIIKEGITRSWSDYVSRERQPGDCISRVTQIRLTSPESSKPDNLFKNKITQPLTSPEFPESDHVPPELPKPDHLNIPRVNITRPSQHPPSKHNQTFCACPEYPNQTFSARPEYPNQTFSARPEYPNQTFCACPEYPKPDFLCTSRVSKTRLSFYVPIIRNQTFCACHEYTTNYRRNSGGTL